MERSCCLEFLSVLLMLAIAGPSKVDGITGAPSVINVSVIGRVVTWDLQQNYTGTVYFYHVLVYRVGHRGSVVPIECHDTFYDLTSLKLSSGSYSVQVQAVTPSGPGPYSSSVMYEVSGWKPYTAASANLHAEKPDLSSLVVVMAIGSTLLLGILFGSFLFVFMIWKLRWRSQRDPLPIRRTTTHKPLGKSVSFQLPAITSTNAHALNTSLNLAYSNNTSSTSLENSTSWLILHDHHTTEASRGVDNFQTRSERVYDSIESLESTPTYVADCDINTPDPILMQQLSMASQEVADSRHRHGQVTRAEEQNEFDVNQTPSEYLEVLLNRTIDCHWRAGEARPSGSQTVTDKDPC